MIVPVMAISNLVLTQQIYSEETNGAHAHYREPVPLTLMRDLRLNCIGPRNYYEYVIVFVLKRITSLVKKSVQKNYFSSLIFQCC